MTLAADIRGNFQTRGAFQSFNFVLGVTIRTGWRLTLAHTQGLTMDTGSKIFRFLIVALPTGGRLSGKVQRRNRRTRWEHFVRIMTILTRSGIRPPGQEGDSMDTRSVTFVLAFMAPSAIHALSDNTVVGMFRRQISMATRTRVGFVN